MQRAGIPLCIIHTRSQLQFLLFPDFLISISHLHDIIPFSTTVYRVSFQKMCGWIYSGRRRNWSWLKNWRMSSITLPFLLIDFIEAGREKWGERALLGYLRTPYLQETFASSANVAQSLSRAEENDWKSLSPSHFPAALFKQPCSTCCIVWHTLKPPCAFPMYCQEAWGSAATLKHFLGSVPELSNATAVFVMISLTTANTHTWYCRSWSAQTW